MPLILKTPWLFKACPKCHGDMFLERQHEGKEWVCLQCGDTREYSFCFLVDKDEGRRVKTSK